MDISSVLDRYDTNALTVAVLGSHSALDVCSGAKRHGFQTLVMAQQEREKTYERYYKSCVDETRVLGAFQDILKAEEQEALRERSAVFVPHRSFQAYLNFDYEAIEERFQVPLFGNRSLLKIEERTLHPNQYDLLREAGIRAPRIFESSNDIDRPVIVKAAEKQRGFERAFFLASSPREFQEKSATLLEEGAFSKEALENAVIEEFILGVQVNLNYFYSPVFGRLEFLGPDTRRQTNIEGLLRLPSSLQQEAERYERIKFEEAGHIAVTLLESMLEDVFEAGERFVAASQNAYPPGVVGPFALQAFILPGPPKKEFVVFDVSPRMPGSPGVRFTPYGEYLWGRPMSAGERISLELQQAVSSNALSSVVT